MNFTIAHFVVTTDVTLKDLEWLLFHTPAQIVVISYDVRMDGPQTIPAKVGKAVENLNSKEEA